MKDFLLSPQGHAAGSMALLLGSQFFPQYAPMIQALSGALGYGAAVMPARRASPKKKK